MMMNEQQAISVKLDFQEVQFKIPLAGVGSIPRRPL